MRFQPALTSGVRQNGKTGDEQGSAWLAPHLLVAAGPSSLDASAIVLHERPLQQTQEARHAELPVNEDEVISMICVKLQSRMQVPAEVNPWNGVTDTDALRPLLRVLAPLPPGGRAKAMRFLLDAAADAFPANWPRALCNRLFACRELLRERLPRLPLISEAARAGYVDSLLAVDDRTFFVMGWFYDEEATMVRLTAVSPEGSRAELHDKLYLHARHDLESVFPARGQAVSPAFGFRCFFTIDHPSRLRQGWILEMENANGDVLEVEIGAQALTCDEEQVRDALLSCLNVERLPEEQLRAHHALPALSCLEKRRSSRVKVTSIDQWGERTKCPDVSVIVPLYRRIDFVEHQIAQFALDDDFRHVDLIYVLDSPELSDAFRSSCEHLHELYAVPLRAVVLSENSGFSTANNLGVSVAEGRLLLLLNSDVLPDEPGWISRLQRFHDSVPAMGALGPKLLYEDHSLQHAGLYFQRRAGSPSWHNEHYYKGLSRHFPPADVTRPVDAISAACMMIDRALYQSLDGLRGFYVQGDYEDSDLCLRLMEAGHENWYFPEVELFHLEGQSYPNEQRLLRSEYNRWLQTYLWNEQIERRVMARK